MPQISFKISAKYQSVFIWLVFLFVAFLLYGRSLNYYFVSDDWHWLWLAKTRPWDWSIFITNYEGLRTGGSYNPFLFVIWKIFFGFFGLKAGLYHLVSLLLQASNTFLVYLLGKKIFSWFKFSPAKNWALLAASLFAIWPTQVEAITWLAAWPHLWATFFYLASLVAFLQWREYRQKLFLFLSGLSFVLGLLVKEVVLTLPLVILLFELYFLARGGSRQSFWKNFRYILVCLVLLVIFLILRQQATQTLFGYYGQTNLSFSLSTWLANFQALILEMATASYFRPFVYKFWYHFPVVAGIILGLILLLYIYYLLRRKKYSQLFLWLLFLVSLLPVIPLGLHRTTFGGERYVYLPSIFFLYWFVYLINKINLSKASRTILLAICLLCSLVIIGQKNIIWQQSSQVARNIVLSYPALGLAPGQTLMTVGLPDNLAGAEVFRNNLQQALILNYPENYPDILPLPIYVQLNRQNANYHLLNWRRDGQGWWAESIDGSFVVTGITSITLDGMYWELWHYNYENYTANLIRLLPQIDLQEKINSGQIKLLTFDVGRLHLIK